MIAVGLLLAVISSYAQNNAISYGPTAYDTLVDADTGLYQYPGVMSMPYGYAVQHSTVKISGTGVSNESWTQGSLDGTNWVNIDSIQTIANASGYRTVTNLTTGVMWPYLRVRDQQTGSTDSTKARVHMQIYPRYDAFYAKSPPIYQLITHDTLTNTDTKAGAYPSALNGVYGYVVQIIDDEVSGSATNTVVVQTSNDNTNWTTLETFTITTDTTVSRSSLTGELGKYVRVYCTNSGTGVHHVDAYIKLALRKY